MGLSVMVEHHYMIDSHMLHVIGILAGILILAGWVEQIYKGYRTKRLRDVSKYLIIFIGAGAALWTAYGIFVNDVFIIGTNVAAIALMCVVLTMKKRYEHEL